MHKRLAEAAVTGLAPDTTVEIHPMSPCVTDWAELLGGPDRIPMTYPEMIEPYITPQLVLTTIMDARDAARNAYRVRADWADGLYD